MCSLIATRNYEGLTTKNNIIFYIFNSILYIIKLNTNSRINKKYSEFNIFNCYR